MSNSKKHSENNYLVYVLRIGHRPQRDKRITTHVALVARAFGAHGFILGDTYDDHVIESITKVLASWGGYMLIEQGVNSRKYVLKWRKRGGEVIHLTMYGLHVDDVIDEIRNSNRDKLIIVGAEKVPPFYYQNADYNIAIGNQPHSEVSALAIFLDKLYEGRELHFLFPKSKIRIVPQKKGKKVVTLQ